jgi:zinc protease
VRRILGVFGYVLGIGLSLPSPVRSQERLPVDPAVTVGTLPNGVRYYIRENRRPEKRAELRLVVNAGSLLEDGDQLGLAHFVEHMAFNGTTHFEKQKLIDFLERSGVQFGAHLNAYTSFDETVYMLALPTDSANIFAQGMQVLEDWAHGVAFDSAEVRKERGVVIEEWRLRRGAQGRVQDRQFPVTFRGSRYASRMPIGTKESLERFDPTALRRFYQDWYRPDLMAVVAVGDFDKKKVERMIRSHFSKIPARKSPRVRAKYGVPVRDSAAAVIVTDKELTGTRVSIAFLRPAPPPAGVASYRADLVSGLYSQMLNERLSELARQADPPFLGAGSGTGLRVRSTEAFSLGVAVPDTGVRRGLAAALTEVERVERHGFLPSELERAKRGLLRDYEQMHAERDKAESGDFADQYVANYLTRDPMPSIAQEYRLVQRLVPGITLAEVNRVARDWLGLKDVVLLVSAPEKPGVTIPPGDSLLALLKQVRSADVALYTETVSDAPLVAAKLEEAPITAERHDSLLDITTWTLGNGVRVILKPTDFKADQVLVSAYSPGGNSLLPDSLVTQGVVAAGVAAGGGWGQFSAIELEKKLTGIAAGVSPSIGTYQEGLGGSASPKDLRTLFELIYLHFSAPRPDSAVFQSMLRRLRAGLANRSASPEAAFGDTLQAVLSQHHPRSRPFTLAQVDSLELGRALAVYRDRFADASDFTFVFVGNFSRDTLRPLVRRYLGNLPALRRGEKPRDLGIAPPDSVVRREVRKGIEPKGQTTIVFTGPVPDLQATGFETSFRLSRLAELLQLRLRERLREELGGTYGVGVSGSTELVPQPRYRFAVSFGSAPERTDELAAAVFAEIDSVRKHGATETDLAKIKETMSRSLETDLKENSFWLGSIASADQRGRNPRELLVEWRNRLNALTSEQLRETAERYLRPERHVRVTLLPER